MGSANIRDLLTCFSPSLDFFAVSSGDGRIKIWDTIKGQLQTEFTDILSSDDTKIYAMSERGHLSVDYTCMKWLSFEGKKKRKLGAMLLLGTGSGDVLALDVAAGQLRWKFHDCHPGGVSSVSISKQRSLIYTAGADGMICEIDPNGGSLIRKFKASTKAVSSMCVSPDGKVVATASAQLKIFNCSDHTKIQKFSGHPGNTRCLILTEDGKYVLSSAVGERYVALWTIDSSKKKSASCVLAMDHPAVYLDTEHMSGSEAENSGFCVLAISETGVCYFWYGKDIEELRSTTPTKISLLLDDGSLKKQKGGLPAIFAAKIQSIFKPAAANVFVAHGLVFRPTFEKIVVHHGNDLKLSISQDGVLLPSSQSRKAKRRLDAQSGATALDRANAEGASIPLPKVFEFDNGKKLDGTLKKGSDSAKGIGTKDGLRLAEDPSLLHGMEERLRSLGILNNQSDVRHKPVLDPNFKHIDLEETLSEKKMRGIVRSMTSNDANKLLNSLVTLWQSRTCGGQQILPWIYNILTIHRHQILFEDHDSATLHSLYRVAKNKGSTVEALMKLGGRLQLLTAQIDKAYLSKSQILQQDRNLVESEDDDVEEVLYNEEDVSESSSDADEGVHDD
ncbi:hypothetical protein Droror1_Dr00001016 [Drosera rotundifolia]